MHHEIPENLSNAQLCQVHAAILSYKPRIFLPLVVVVVFIVVLKAWVPFLSLAFYPRAFAFVPLPYSTDVLDRLLPSPYPRKILRDETSCVCIYATIRLKSSRSATAPTVLMPYRCAVGHCTLPLSSSSFSVYHLSLCWRRTGR